MAAVEPVSAEAGAPTTHTQTPTQTSTRPVAPSPDHRDEKPSEASPTRSGSFGSLFSDGISDPENGGDGDGDGDGRSKGARNNKAPPWRKYGSFNPLRWRVPPPVPAQRAISQEATAGLFSRTTFMWITDLMKVRTQHLPNLRDRVIIESAHIHPYSVAAPRQSSLILQHFRTNHRRLAKAIRGLRKGYRLDSVVLGAVSVVLTLRRINRLDTCDPWNRTTFPSSHPVGRPPSLRRSYRPRSGAVRGRATSTRCCGRSMRSSSASSGSPALAASSPTSCWSSILSC